MAHTPYEKLSRAEQLLFSTLARNVQAFLLAEGISARELARRCNERLGDLITYKTIMRVIDRNGVQLSAVAILARGMKCEPWQLLKPEEGGK
jgi:hypothetical protein